MNWSVYIILCSDDSLYTGITIDIERRIKEHSTGIGAKYFRNRSPKELVYLETGHNRSTATKREMAIKKLSKIEKSAIITCSETATSLNSLLTPQKILI